MASSPILPSELIAAIRQIPQASLHLEKLRTPYMNTARVHNPSWESLGHEAQETAIADRAMAIVSAAKAIAWNR